MLISFLISFSILILASSSSEEKNKTNVTQSSNDPALLINGWVGNYVVDEEKTSCSLLKCLCCPAKNSVIKIDKNTAFRERSSYIIRGTPSGLLCRHQFLSDFLLIDQSENSTEAQGKLFDSSFRMIKLKDRIRFDDEDSPRCSFSLIKYKNIPAQYDVVIDINSILQFEKTGWAITIRDPKDYEAKKQIDTIVIGMAGHYNKGKTWFLNHISEREFEHGFHSNTVGLSMKYSEFDTKVASYLDTAGFETPIKYYIKDKEYNLIKEQEEIVSKSIFQRQAEENRKINKFSEWQKEKLKDRHFTEDLIQNFIFEKSHIIIIVVGRLTFSDQKMIHKILATYGNSNKEVLIIHNFHELEEISHVMEMADHDIFQSFDIKAGILEISKQLSDKNKYYHQEIYIDRSYQKVRHLITARDGTEAGKFFNPPVFDFLQALIQSKSPTETFDIVQNLQDYLRNILPRYIDFSNQTAEPEIRLATSDGITYLKCHSPVEFKLKPVTFDVNGALIKSSILDNYLEYDMKISGDFVIFTINLPGLKKDPETGKRKINYRWERLDRTCLVFEAELEERDVEEDDLLIIQNRKKGMVRVNPPCLDPGYDVENSYISVELEDGVLELTFPLIKKNLPPVSLEL